MRISHKYKFVFLCKPRSASTSIRTLLDPYSDIFGCESEPFHYHATALEIKMQFDKERWNWNDYFIFTSVRNPWDMMVSYYEFFRPDINYLYNYETERFGIRYQPGNPCSFTNWILNGHIRHILLYKNGVFLHDVWKKGFSRLSLATMINDIDGRNLVNEIIKVENLKNSLLKVFKHLGLNEIGSIHKINYSFHKSYRDYYNVETKKIIETEFASDIEFGRYTF